MYFQYTFARFHDVDHGATSSYIKGKLRGEEVFNTQVTLNKQDNQWVVSR